MQNNFFGVKRALTDGALKQFETEYNIAMPLKIREHYLKYNGGYPERNVFYSVEDERQYIVNYFFSIGCGEGMTIEKTLPLLRESHSQIRARQPGDRRRCRYSSASPDRPSHR